MRFIFTLLLLFTLSKTLTQTNKNYERFIDSADNALNIDAHKALMFLDSIPVPIEKHIDGRVGSYYLLQGYAYDRTMQEAKVLQSYLLSYRNAKGEKDFDTAANASLELFTYTYFVKKDTTAYKYLEEAEKYYSLSNNINGKVKVKQMPAYVAFTKREYDKSNQLIL